jgi:hypothetical protein
VLKPFNPLILKVQTMQTTIKINPYGECTITTEWAPASEPIAATEATPVQSRTIQAVSSPKIGEVWGEGKYAGISVGEDGQPDHPLALLSHKAEKPMTWEEAKAWAASFGDGARLPTKREAALLYANLPDEFDKSDWHWTSTPSSASDAWLQGFHDGLQLNFSKSSERLCRAVR